jgi:hypothetical protein
MAVGMLSQQIRRIGEPNRHWRPVQENSRSRTAPCRELAVDLRGADAGPRRAYPVLRLGIPRLGAGP